MRRHVTVSVDVDVMMENFDDEDLVEELEARGYVVTKIAAATPSAEAAYLAARPMLDRPPDPLRSFILEQSKRVC